jgi:hypothetical protein
MPDLHAWAIEVSFSRGSIVNVAFDPSDDVRGFSKIGLKPCIIFTPRVICLLASCTTMQIDLHPSFLACCGIAARCCVDVGFLGRRAADGVGEQSCGKLSMRAADKPVWDHDEPSTMRAGASVDD